MELDVANPNVANKLISDIESNEIKERTKSDWKAYVCYNGATGKYTKEELKKQFPEDSKVMQVSDINLSEKIVRKKAAAYEEGVDRQVSDDATNAKTEEYSRIAKEGDLDNAFQLFDEYFHLVKRSAMWIVDRDGMLMFEVLQPGTYFPVVHPHTRKLLAMILKYPDNDVTGFTLGNDGMDQMITESQADSGTDSRVYAMYTDTQKVLWRVETVKGTKGMQTQVTYIEDPENKRNENPLGMLQFYYRSAEPSADLPIESPLTDQSIQFNVLMSHGLTAASLQGFGDLVITGPKDLQIKKFNKGFRSAMLLPQTEDFQTSAQYINANPDLSGQMGVYSSYAQQVLSCHGINGDSITGDSVAEFSSGLERLIANADVSKHVTKMQKIYADAEQIVFDIVKAYSTENGNNIFSDGDTITVTYKKPKVLISDSERLANIKERLALGLMTKEEAHMELNPNLSEEDAKEREERFEEMKRRNVEEFRGALQENKESLPENDGGSGGQ